MASNTICKNNNVYLKKGIINKCIYCLSKFIQVLKNSFSIKYSDIELKSFIHFIYDLIGCRILFCVNKIKV